jgi:hypothetical protein
MRSPLRFPLQGHMAPSPLSLSLCDILLYYYLRVELEFVPRRQSRRARSRATLMSRSDRRGSPARGHGGVCASARCSVDAYSWPCRKTELRSPDPIGPVGFSCFDLVMPVNKNEAVFYGQLSACTA